MGKPRRILSPRDQTHRTSLFSLECQAPFQRASAMKNGAIRGVSMEPIMPEAPSLRVRYTESFAQLPPERQDEHLELLWRWLLSAPDVAPRVVRRHRLQRHQQVGDAIQIGPDTPSIS